MTVLLIGVTSSRAQCYNGAMTYIKIARCVNGTTAYNQVRKIDPFFPMSDFYGKGNSIRKRRDASYQNSYEAPNNIIDVGKVIVLPPPGVAPKDVPQVGEPGGGAPPETDPYTANMAPEGTVPIAVFPPFEEYKKYPTKCVIFSELTDFEKEDIEPFEPYTVRRAPFLNSKSNVDSAFVKFEIIIPLKIRASQLGYSEQLWPRNFVKASVNHSNDF